MTAGRVRLLRARCGSRAMRHGPRGQRRRVADAQHQRRKLRAQPGCGSCFAPSFRTPGRRIAAQGQRRNGRIGGKGFKGACCGRSLGASSHGAFAPVRCKNRAPCCQARRATERDWQTGQTSRRALRLSRPAAHGSGATPDTKKAAEHDSVRLSPFAFRLPSPAADVAAAGWTVHRACAGVKGATRGCAEGATDRRTRTG